MFGNSVKGRGAFVFGPVLFRALDFLPVRPDFIDVFNFGFAEDVRMAANQFVGDIVATKRGEVELMKIVGTATDKILIGQSLDVPGLDQNDIVRVLHLAFDQEK